jgi:hypothetical protein
MLTKKLATKEKTKTQKDEKDEKAKKTKTKEKDEEPRKRRRSKRRKAFVRLLPLTGIHRWLCRFSPLTDKKTTTHLLFSSFCISQNNFFLLR